MRALSILQPWAWLIVHGYKDIENRSWSTKVRGPVLVHAGKRYTRASHAVHAFDLERLGIHLPPFETIQLGGVVGAVDITDCVRHHPSRWKDPDSYGFVLANARPLSFMPWRGQLGFFDIPLPTLRAIEARE